MRILHIVNTPFFANRLLSGKLELLAKRHQIELASPDADSVRLPYPVHRLEIPRSPCPECISALEDCCALLEKERFDAVHTHSSMAGFIGRLACALTNTPCVHTSHGLPFYEGQRYCAYAACRALEKYASSHCRAILTQNREDMLSLLEAGVQTPLFYEGSGVRLDYFRRCRRLRSQARKQLGITENTLLIGCFARVEPVKGWETLVQALALAAPRNAVLLACGKNMGRRAGYAEKIDALLGSAPFDVIRPGFRDDASQLLAGCDIAALASRKEGLPRILMEAAAMGIPAVATDVPGTREAVLHGVTGLLSAAGDAFSMAQNIRLLCDDPRLRKRLGAQAYKLARREFDERLAARRILRVYDAIRIGNL